MSGRLYYRIVFVGILYLAISVLLPSVCATELVKLRLRENYWDIYGGHQEIEMKYLRELDGDQTGIETALKSNIEDFSHFLCSVNDGPFEKSLDGAVEVRFKDIITPQKTKIAMKAVSKKGDVYGPYVLDIDYVPKEYCESLKMSGYPNICYFNTGPYFINFPAVRVEDWIYPKPTEQEKEFALKKWGHLVEGLDSDYEKAKVLAKALMEDLWPHNGFPTDAMNVPPFEQYERMISGKDKGFCSNFAAIFVRACNCFGVPARGIHMRKIHSVTDKCRIQRGGLHGSTEIFDKEMNQWIWMDLMFYVLGAYLGEQGPLNVAEFHLFLNQPARKKALRLNFYDYEKTKTEMTLPLAECPKNSFGSFEGWETEFHYRKIKSQEIPKTGCKTVNYESDAGRVLIEHPGGMAALCRAANGDLLLAHSTVWEPFPPGSVIKLMRSTDDGKTWSRPRVIVRPDSPSCSAKSWASLALMQDGSLIFSYYRTCASRLPNVPKDETRPIKIWDLDSVKRKSFVIRSADHGRTWSQPVELCPELDRCQAMGRPLITANGDVILPLIPFVNIDDKTYPASGFVRSTDGGKTWRPLEIIANGPDGYNEVTLGLAKNGDIIAILRDRLTGPRRVFWQTISHDNGRSWQQPWKTDLIGKMPDMLTLPCGRMLLAVGSLDCMDGSFAFTCQPGTSYAGLVYSDDNGKTWQKDLILPSPDPANIVPFDAPLLALLRNGDIMALNCAYDKRYKDDPLCGWTRGFHYVLNTVRQSASK